MAWRGDHRTTTERGLGWAWQKSRKQALKRDGYLCIPCLHNGRPTTATEVDHIISRENGGTNDLDNLQSICSDCHKHKTQVEAAEAQGRTYRPRVTVGLDGWPKG